MTVPRAGAQGTGWVDGRGSPRLGQDDFDGVYPLSLADAGHVGAAAEAGQADGGGGGADCGALHEAPVGSVEREGGVFAGRGQRDADGLLPGEGFDVDAVCPVACGWRVDGVGDGGHVDRGDDGVDVGRDDGVLRADEAARVGDAEVVAHVEIHRAAHVVVDNELLFLLDEVDAVEGLFRAVAVPRVDGGVVGVAESVFEEEVLVALDGCLSVGHEVAVRE